METSQEQNFLNPRNQNSTNSASKQGTEVPIARLSSSSSSSCSSIEAEPKPEENINNNAAQSPPTQIMERSTNDTTTTTTTTEGATTPSYRIPSHVFARTTSTTPVEWSTLSNESLFSIHMGNNSFTARDYLKSGELTFPQPPSPMAPPLASPSPPPPNNTNQEGGGVVEEPKNPVDIAKKAAETDKAYRASKEEEQKAAASIREVIMANEAANKDNNNNKKNNNNKSNMLNRSVSRRTEDFSRKSFAFPILGNADKGGLQGSAPQKKSLSPETPNVSTEAENDEGMKKEEAPKQPETLKAEADRASNRNPKWLSCFPCCTTLCG